MELRWIDDHDSRLRVDHRSDRLDCGHRGGEHRRVDRVLRMNPLAAKRPTQLAAEADAWPALDLDLPEVVALPLGFLRPHRIGRIPVDLSAQRRPPLAMRCPAKTH